MVADFVCSLTDGTKFVARAGVLLPHRFAHVNEPTAAAGKRPGPKKKKKKKKE